MAVFNRSDARRKRITGLIFSFSGGKLTKIIYAFDREFQLLSNDTLIFTISVSDDF